MPNRTSIDDVEKAVAAVGQMQQQVAGLLEAIKRLTLRVEALEAKPPRARRTAARTKAGQDG